ncbi:unnamed protein product [Caenorhabditis sp. 36 PRJEB53466]|nr:unnamed protein product [Caenorhabditis sp. 36 PRJEB53466]
MYIKAIISIVLAFFVSADTGHCFSVASSDGIALEPDSVLVSDEKAFFPLGWPAELKCEAVDKLGQLNVNGTNDFQWKFRDRETGIEQKVQNVSSSYFVQYHSYLHIRKVIQRFDKFVFECRVARSGNTTLVSRIRLEIQDCEHRTPEGTAAFNVHNPCAFGQCLVNNQNVECLCFKQYTGRYCNKRKANAWLYDALPFGLALLVFVAFFFVKCTMSLTNKNRKEEKLMGISGFAGFSDRKNFQLKLLYPFIKKIRKCRYESDEEVIESSARKKRRAEKRALKRIQMEEMSMALSGAATSGTGTGTSGYSGVYSGAMSGMMSGTGTGTGTGTMKMETDTGTGPTGSDRSGFIEDSPADVWREAKPRGGTKRKKNRRNEEMLELVQATQEPSGATRSSVSTVSTVSSAMNSGADTTGGEPERDKKQKTKEKKKKRSNEIL